MTFRYPGRLTALLPVIIGFALMGALFLVATKASTYAAYSEAETGTVAGNAVIVDGQGASNGKAVSFQSGGQASSKIYGATGIMGYNLAADARQRLGINGTRDCHDEVDIATGIAVAAQQQMITTLCVGDYEGMKSLDGHRQDYANTMATMARTYGPGGTYWQSRPQLAQYAVQSFTTMNEPYGWWYRDADNDPAAYARITRDAIKAGKAANPQAKFYVGITAYDVKLQNGTWIKWNDAILQAVPELFTLADGFEIHFYGAPAEVAAKLDEVKSQVWAKPGGQGKPFIITELNLIDGVASPEAEYVAAMPQFVQMAKSRPWLKEIHIFTYHGYPERDWLGFLDSDGNIRQQRINAYRDAIAQARQ